MAPTRISIPDDAVFYRGDQWVARFYFSRDVSDQDFVLQFKHSRLGPVIVTATRDASHAADDPAYVDFTVSGEDTAVLRYNLLTGDLQAAADDTWLTFSIPIRGQFAGGGSGAPTDDVDLTVNVTLSDTDVDLVVNVEVGGETGPPGADGTDGVDGATGATGAAGPTGPSGTAGDFTFTQASPATTWTIDHNLGRNPSVTVIVDGTQVDCSVTYTDDDHLELGFSVAVSGVAYLN